MMTSVLFEIQTMKADILFLDGVNIARSYLHLYLMINNDSITGHTVKNNRRSRDLKEPIGIAY
jgi:hypothetical protein